MAFTMACPNFKKGLKMVSGALAFRGLMFYLAGLPMVTVLKYLKIKLIASLNLST
jgi:serine protease inhibitor ecotin